VLVGFLVLLLCQLLGELIVIFTGWPVPGPVLGMILLIALLLTLKNTPESVRQVAEGLLKYLSFLYVPAGVGLMVQYKLLETYWFALTISLLVSTFLAMSITAIIFKLGARLARKSKEES
jgi:holin-like protein